MPRGFSFGLGRGLTFPGGAGGIGGTPAHQQLLDLATADGWTALYDPTNPDTRTLREDGGDTFVEAISDGLGNRPDLVQTTAANQPRLVTGKFGQLDGAEFDGADDIMSTVAFAAVEVQPNFRVGVAETRSAGTQGILTTITSGERNQVFVATGPELRLHAGLFVSSGLDLSLDTPFVLGALFNGAASKGFVDSVEGAEVDAGAESFGGARWGANAGGSGDFLDGFVGIDLIFDGDPSASVRTSMFDLLHDLTGIAKA